jgi:hypothetical protein
MGNVARAEGNLAEAIAHYRDAVNDGLASGDRRLLALVLRSFAGVLVDQDWQAAAARLFGAAEAVRSLAGFSFAGIELPSREVELSLLRARMGDTEFEAAFIAGEALSLEKAAAEALAVADELAMKPHS